MALPLLAGHVQLWYYFMWAALLYSLYRGFQRRTSPGCWLSLARWRTAGPGAGGRTGLPGAQLASLSVRAGGAEEGFAMAYSLWPWQIAGMVAPISSAIRRWATTGGRAPTGIDGLPGNLASPASCLRPREPKARALRRLPAAIPGLPGGRQRLAGAGDLPSSLSGDLPARSRLRPLPGAGSSPLPVRPSGRPAGRGRS